MLKLPRSLICQSAGWILLAAVMSMGRCAGAASPDAAGHTVIVVVANRLLPEDLERWAPADLKTLIRKAAVGVVSSRGASFEGDAGGFGSIGAGAGVAAPRMPLPRFASEMPAYAAAMGQSSREAHTAAQPGALGQAVEDAGGFTALIGNASTGEDRSPGGVTPETSPALAALLIAMDAAGRVSVDDSEKAQTRAPSWPYGRRCVPRILAEQAAHLIAARPSKQGLIVVDFGDSDRADSWSWLNHATPTQAARARAFWLPRVLSKLDDLVEPLYRLAASRGGALCLVSPVPPRRSDGGPEPGLTPAAIWNPGGGAGALTSPSTRRSGLLLGLDLAPTFLESLGISPPLSMTGQPAGLWSSPVESMSAAELSRIFSLDERSRSDYRFEAWGLTIYGVLAGLSVLLAFILPAPLLVGGRKRILELLLLAGLSGPAALIIPMATPAPGWIGPALLTLFLWLAAPLLLFRFRRPRQRLLGACTLPAAVLLLDGLSRGSLFRDALWGRMPIAGGRLYGIDNTCMGVLIGAAWVALGVAGDLAGGRRARMAGPAGPPAAVEPASAADFSPAAESSGEAALPDTAANDEGAAPSGKNPGPAADPGPVSSQSEQGPDAVEVPTNSPAEPELTRARRRRSRTGLIPDAPFLAVMGAVLVAIVIGLSPLGANVGGGITAAVGAGFFGMRLLLRRGRWAGGAAGALLAAVILAISLELDASHALSPGSHLIHNWRQVAAAPSIGIDIAIRKLWQNGALTLWILPGLLPLWAICRVLNRDSKAFRARLAASAGLDAALRSLIPTMVVGYFFNDTGVITDVFIALYYLGALGYLRLGMIP